MKAMIETNRLMLRELTIKDIENLSLILTNPDSMRFYPHPFSRDEVEKWINWNMDNYEQYGFGLWGVILKENNELIGDCGITMQEIENSKFPEIGYHIRKNYCGMGFATEAAKACIEFAFHKMSFLQICSYMRIDNLASRRVAEKNGLIFQKTFTKKVCGENVQEALYIKENKEIQASRRTRAATRSADAGC